MPRIAPRASLGEELGDVTLPEAEGTSVRLGTLWQREQVLLVHLRHFGCLFCRDRVEKLIGYRDYLKRMATRLVAIGTGSVKHALGFKQHFGIDWPLLVDEWLDSYRLVGVQEGKCIDWLSPSVVRASLTAIRAGSMHGRLGKAPTFLGATHLIRPGGAVAFAWLNAEFHDDAPLGEVMAAVAG